LPLKEGQYLASARLELSDDDYFKPIKHFEIDPEEFETDPYGAIVPEMIGRRDASNNAATMVQVLIRPAWSNHSRDRKNWYHGVEHTAERLKKGEVGWRPSAAIEGFAQAFTGGNGEDIDHTKARPS